MVFNASFEDVLPLLIGVGWIIYSALKGGKKSDKKQEVVEESEIQPEDTKSVLDHFFEELAGIEKEDKNGRINEELKKDLPEREVFSYDDPVEKEIFKEEKVENLIFNEEKLDENNRIEKRKMHKKSSFDLRKAFIYSEILKKKYI